MAEEKHHIAKLIIQDFNQELDAAGQQELEQWLAQSELHRQLFDSYRNEDLLLFQLKIREKIDQPAAWNKFSEKLTLLRSASAPKTVNLWNRIFHWKPGAMRMLTALAIAAILSLVIYELYRNFSPVQVVKGLAVRNYQTGQGRAGSGHSVKDLLKQGKKAILVFAIGAGAADSTLIDLDAASIGTIARQGGLSFTKKDSSMIACDRVEDKAPEPFYCRLYTAQGRSYSLRLPDSSKISLNASSSLRFPASLGIDGRQVDLEGEAYFEVIKAKTPFTVFIGDEKAEPLEIDALGTSFNVMAYPEDEVSRTTLIKGAVNIRIGKLTKPLRQSGQQFSLYGRDKHGKTNMVNMADALAWTTNSFSFENASLDEIVHQLNRWYVPKIVDEDPLEGPLTLKGSRNEPLSALLDRLAYTGHVQVQYGENNKIIITRRSDTKHH